MDKLHEKKQLLVNILRDAGSAAVAFSAGVDSTFLLKTAHEVLGKNALAVTADAPLFPRAEIERAKQFCAENEIRHIILPYDPFSVPGFQENPPDRCYLCKRAVFTAVKAAAAERGITYIAEGSNTDDTGDYRPGMRAVRELGIRSPLLEAGLSKADIRELSREYGLATWNKPSFACLASRFMYGDTITAEKLAVTEKAEEKLLSLGFTQVRVRVHGTSARIEIDRSEFPKILQPEIADGINEYFRSLGFLYTSLDLGGYRTGNMNKTLNVR